VRLSRYLSPARFRRAVRLLLVWWGMPRRIRRQPMSTLLPALDPRHPPSTPPPGALEDIADAAVLLVDRWKLPLDDRCLPRTLSLYHCLRAEGIPVEIVFGVRPGPKLEEGHAWLELDGRPLMEPARRMQGFLPIFRHPGPREETNPNSAPAVFARNRR